MQWGSQLLERRSKLPIAMIGRYYFTSEKEGLQLSKGFHCTGNSSPYSILPKPPNCNPCIPPIIKSLANSPVGWAFSRHISFYGSSKIKDKIPTTFPFTKYRQAIGLQIEGFLKRNSLLLYATAGAFLCFLLWRIMFWIANISIGLSEGLAKYGFLALSSAIVAFAGMYLRSRLGINPDKVYRMAMANLNTSASILEVMGAPLTGTDVRAFVMSGGGFKVKNLKPAFRPKRCFLIFPIQGSERRGIVSVEVKKKKGNYDMKLLAVDVPVGGGSDQRFFLHGDEKEYNVGGGFIYELRDSLVKAIAARKEFDDLDRIEDENAVKMEEENANREGVNVEKDSKGAFWFMT